MNWFVIIAGLAYIGAGIQSSFNGNKWFAGMYLCYFLANVCILMAELNSK